MIHTALLHMLFFAHYMFYTCLSDISFTFFAGDLLVELHHLSGSERILLFHFEGGEKFALYVQTMLILKEKENISIKQLTQLNTQLKKNVVAVNMFIPPPR
ncbi:hypothetical protein ACJX0J_029453 [Zea mays]